MAFPPLVLLAKVAPKKGTHQWYQTWMYAEGLPNQDNLTTSNQKGEEDPTPRLLLFGNILTNSEYSKSSAPTNAGKYSEIFGSVRKHSEVFISKWVGTLLPASFRNLGPLRHEYQWSRVLSAFALTINTYEYALVGVLSIIARHQCGHGSPITQDNLMQGT